jgi:hypothetical protein
MLCSLAKAGGGALDILLAVKQETQQSTQEVLDSFAGYRLDHVAL